MITDSAFTMVIDEEPKGDVKRLIEATEASLYAGLEEIDAGDHIGDISEGVQAVLEQAHLGIIRELVGHGIGHDVHEMPDIPNYGKNGTGPTLKKHMSIAVEPMATLGSNQITTDNDGWTIRTVDGSIAAHFEHTVLVLEDGCEILTSL
jgi:methionyl aminopeptidase